MANYTNRLDGFNSHSVHYVVLACRSTEDIRSFTDTSDAGATKSLQAIDNCKMLGDEVQLGNTHGSVFLMLDTRRFSQFTIDSFSLETLVAGLSVPGSSSPNSTGIKMSFEVIDSVGISFANFLQYLMDKKLQVSFNGMTVLVRLLFVGHHLDGSTEIIQSTSIPAIFNKIEVDLNDTKGIYKCDLFPLVGMPSNAGYNAKWTSIGTASSYFTGVGDNSLGAVINSFESRLNEQSLKRYAQQNGTVQVEGKSSVSVGRYGRPVQYMITIPASWEPFKFNGPTQHGAVEISFKQIQAELLNVEAARAKTVAEAQKKAQQNAKAPGKDSFVAVDPDLTITEALDVIFSQCTEVAQLGNFTKKQDTHGDLKFYKHLVTVTSDDTSFTVHVDIVEFMVPNAKLNEKSNTTLSQYDKLLFKTEKTASGQIIKKVPLNFIELDYIFSGKNLDVINLDLKIENLNWLLMQDSKLGAAALNGTAAEGQLPTDGEGVSEDRRIVQGMRAKDPALIPQRTADEAKNFNNIAGNATASGEASPQAINQQYKRNIAAFYNAGPIVAKLTLRGNPDLLDRVSLSQLPQHVSTITVANTGVSSTANGDVKKQYRDAFERNLLRIGKDVVLPKGPLILPGPSFVTSPVFVKVNVFGPNVDFMTNELIAGQDFSQELFYDNYYWLGRIISRIDGTNFTQELELTSYSVYGYSTAVAKNGNASIIRSVK